MENTNVLHLTTENFEAEVMNASQPVVVDFWAPWCGPCRMVGPVMEQLAAQYTGKAKICKVNVDEQSGLASKFKVMSIPSIIVFKNGEVVDKTIGARSKEDFEKMINKVL